MMKQPVSIIAYISLLQAMFLCDTLSAGWQLTEVSGSAGASFTHGYSVPIDDEELSVSAGVAAGDYDNDGDGWLDLYHVNGFHEILNDPDLYLDDPARLFINDRDDTFTENAASLGVDDQGLGRGAVCFDYDLDGDIDIFIANNDGPSRLYRNDLALNPGYLQVRLLRYPRSKTIAGSVIEIDIGDVTQMREVTIGSNFESQNPLLQHFGLGGAPSIDELRVRWPSGEVTTLTGVTPNQVLVIDQDPALFRQGFEP
jgi:hypothetical protein